MRFSTAIVMLASAGFAAAQTATAAAPAAQSSCAAQYIVDKCKKMIQAQIDDCEPLDWVCKCDQYTNLLTCYNNCPDSQEKYPVQNSVTQYCAAAAPAKASMSSVMKTASSVSQPSTPTASPTSSSSDDDKKGSATTGFAATGSVVATGAAVAMYVPQVGVMAVAGVIAGML
ncbi:hypothetical protein GQ43DRAFT_122631 [Delitschia confertaspora ATCC 74209]|uniref:GPI anchored serine-threonine rich protein n=1 Tax=Delitschia confertaspora ATCC 74209 TaxID=1513339 RepID=A0A9P4MT22_9PLEO|nr:hypothetical protein GQ43DRAFT_122631 [Delitschia confertaspora ATCC 74209]